MDFRRARSRVKRISGDTDQLQGGRTGTQKKAKPWRRDRPGPRPFIRLLPYALRSANAYSEAIPSTRQFAASLHQFAPSLDHPFSSDRESVLVWLPYLPWRGVRAVEGARLESVCRGNSTVGSNPTLSAIPIPFLVLFIKYSYLIYGVLGAFPYSRRAQTATPLYVRLGVVSWS